MGLSAAFLDLSAATARWALHTALQDHSSISSSGQHAAARTHGTPPLRATFQRQMFAKHILLTIIIIITAKPCFASSCQVQKDGHAL
jgi:hypothetical protein